MAPSQVRGSNLTQDRPPSGAPISTVPVGQGAPISSDPRIALLKNHGVPSVFCNDPIISEVLDRVIQDMGPLGDLRLAMSSDSTVTFISSNRDFVIQHFLPNGMNGIKRVAARMQEIVQTNSERPGVAAQLLKHVAKIYWINEDLRLASVEKVTPLDDIYKFGTESKGTRSPAELRPNVAKLNADINQAIEVLAAGRAGVSQSDERLSNVGMKGDDFLLFDFNMAEPTREGTVGVSKGRFKKSRDNLLKPD